ncbi:hypothetical protein ES703_36459 [subsurface metagenome]
MPYSDPEKRKEYHREYQRLRRAGEATRAVIKPASKTLNPEQTETARGLLRILGHLVGQVLESEQGDAFIKARTVAYVVSVALRAIETSDLEARLTSLENKVLGGKK